MITTGTSQVDQTSSLEEGSELYTSSRIEEASSSDLKIFECIGKGGFANVYRGCWQGKEVAVKIIAFEGYAGVLFNRSFLWVMHAVFLGAVMA